MSRRPSTHRPVAALVLLTMLVSSPVFAQSDASASTDADAGAALFPYSGQFLDCVGNAHDWPAQKQCLQQEARRQDLRLNGAYQTLRRRRPDMQTSLAAVQNQWLQYRDSYCQLLTQLAPERDTEDARDVAILCQVNMAAQRSTELEAMQD